MRENMSQVPEDGGAQNGELLLQSHCLHRNCSVSLFSLVVATSNGRPAVLPVITLLLLHHLWEDMGCLVPSQVPILAV